MRSKVFLFFLMLTLIVGVGIAQEEQVTTHPRCTRINEDISDVIRVSDAAEGVRPFCNIIAENGEFTRDSSEIGNKGVLDRGVIHAVDVFTINGENPIGARVCLRGDEGDLLFLDSRTAPRTLMVLQSVRIGDFICGYTPSAGMAVLVEPEEGVERAEIETIADDDDLLTESSTAAELDETEETSIADAVVTSGVGRPVENCRVTTNDILNLRSDPSMNSTVIDLVPYNLTLRATELTDDWAKVVYLDGQGWLSADYLRFSAGCDA